MSKSNIENTNDFKSYDKVSNFSEWYQHVVFDLDLLRYYDVSGCYVMMPASYSMWEKIQKFLDLGFKNIGVENVYMPLFIKEENLNKESNHINGFKPEVAWVTQAGNSILNDKLAIRPTSECIFYPTFKNVIKSWKDMPLKWNQWCNVVRWEFSDPTPFIRSREFLWNEGHCAFSSYDESHKNALEMIDIYANFYKYILNIPVIRGKKTEGEKFAGAAETFTIETFISECGKGIQCATSHNLSNNFSKMFDIRFQKNASEADIESDTNTDFAFTTSWGCTTRSIGTMIATHGDNNGLILPSNIAEYHIVIIPIFKKNRDQIMDYCKEIEIVLKKLQFRTKLDSSEKHPGNKYYYWEQRGIPLRFEIGSREQANRNICVFRRDTMKKDQINFTELENLNKLLLEYDNNLYLNASNKLHNNLLHVDSYDDLKELVLSNANKLYISHLCNSDECEAKIKDLKIKPLCRPYYVDIVDIISDFDLNKKMCLVCGSDVSQKEFDGLCLFSKGF